MTNGRAAVGLRCATEADEDEEVPPYDQWVVPELHEELEARDIEYKKSASKPELVKLLEDDDR